MQKYMIHSCKTREWYVQQYLIPSMINQGINRSDIILYLDMNNKGCLESCIRSFALTGDFDCDSVWHLQDDVLICKDFAERTNVVYDADIVCGFASKYDKNVKPGKGISVDNIWYSFPCIKIPNIIAKQFSDWFSLQDDIRFKLWIKHQKNDDLLFRYFLDEYYHSIEGINLAPNLVEHVDWLIGGSVVNRQRKEIIRSIYWSDNDLVENLKNALDI